MQAAELLLIVLLQGTWAALASHAWTPPAQILVKAIADRLQQHNLRLVGRAYATIGPSKLAAILGMTPDAAVQGKLCLWAMCVPCNIGCKLLDRRGGFAWCCGIPLAGILGVLVVRLYRMMC